MKNNKNDLQHPESKVWPSPKLALMLGTGLIVSGCSTFRLSNDPSQAELSQKLMQKIDERDQKLAERDKVIDNLMQRVQQLEGNNTSQQQVNRPVNAAATTANAVSTPATSVAASTASASQKQPDQKSAGAPAQQAKTSGPGSFEVDENAAQRALERTLVQTGALLLPVGQAEIQPYVSYTRRETKEPLLGGSIDFVNQTTNLQVLNASIDRNEFDMGARLLVGLPYEAQAEFRIPYKSTHQSLVVPNGLNSREVSNTGNSLGDISIGLAKTLVHEGEWMPDLVGRLTWDAPTGNMVSNNVNMGLGYNSFTASVTALKRQDPLAFTATAAYKTTLKSKGVEPGDQASLGIGATLAASPQTSLSVGLQQTYSQATKINNVTIQGSDSVSSAFTLGASSTIGRRLFVSVLGGIGLTNDSPAYFFNITIPFRFDVPYK